MENKESGTIAAVCFSLIFIFIVFAGVYAVGYKNGTTVAVVSSPVYRRGELPTGIPVLLYWMESDGTITATSALRTDYAGVLPFSTTHHAVPISPMSGWFAWSELKPISMEALNGL